MGYSQQDYDRYVADVTAQGADGAPLAVEREEGPRFRLGAAGTGVRRLGYRVDLARMEREILGASDASRARPRYAEPARLLGVRLPRGLRGAADPARA